MDSSEVIFIVLLALVGLVVGSAVNVAIVRVPEGASMITSRSKCLSCETELAIRDSIPVLSWFMLRGKCRTCAARISPRFPIVEFITALIWAMLAAYALEHETLGLLPLLLIASAILIALFVIDLDHKRLPDRLTFLMYPVVLIGFVIDGLSTGNWPIGSALIGAAVWLLPIGGMWFLSAGRGMGMGDVKLAPALGLILGWISVGSAVAGLILAWLIGGVVAIGLIIFRRASSGSAIPFGPFLVIGFWLGVLIGAALSEGYLGAGIN